MGAGTPEGSAGWGNGGRVGTEADILEEICSG